MLNVIMAYMMAQVSASEASTNLFASITLPIVVVLGFAAAVTLGSIAWYNSKRPMGWQDKERPDFVPEVKQSETPGLGTPES